MRAAESIAGFAVATHAAALPQPVLSAARRAILDVLSVMVAGSRSQTAAAARRALLPAATEGAATVVGTPWRASASTAALLNGISAHALDFDDVWADDDGVRAWRGHPSVCVLPAVLAASETGDARGADVVAGYVAGVEVAGKLGTAFGPQLGRTGWHPTVVLGTVAAAAGAARVLGLDADRTAIALGLAASEAGGLHRNFGTDTKPFHAGHAARCGLDAALLAGAGFTANPGAVDEYLRVFGAPPGGIRVLQELGALFDLVAPGLSVKKYPCCRFAHLPLDALFECLEANPVEAGAVGEVVATIEPGADDALVCPDACTGLEGKFSLPYVLAAAIVDRRLTLASFTDDAVARPEIRRLMARVRTVYDEAPGAEITINAGALSDSRRALVVRGDPANPLTAEEELDKCRLCVDGILPQESTRRIPELVGNLATADSPKDLIALLAAPAPSPLSARSLR